MSTKENRVKDAGYDRDVRLDSVCHTALDTPVKQSGSSGYLDKELQHHEILRTILDNIPDVVALQKRDHSIICYNKAGYEFLGKSPEEVRGKKCYRLIGRDRPCEKCATRLALRSGRSEVVERYVDELGVWLSVRAIPVYDENGEIDLVVEQLQDITTRKKAERDLVRANSILRRSPAVAFLWQNAEGWPVQFVSDNVCDVLGYSAQDFITGRVHYADLIHRQDMDKVIAEVQQASHDPALDSFGHEPYRLITKSGDIIWVDDRTRLTRNAMGEVIFYEGIILDITKQVESNRALAISEEKYFSLVESSHLGIVQIDAEMNILSMNKRMREWLSFDGTPKQAKCYDVVNEVSQETQCRNCPAKQSFATGQIHESVMRKSIQGRTRSFRIIAAPVFDSDGVIQSVVESVEDITDRVKMESELLKIQKLESVGTLAGGIAHDFNNLLAAIMGNASLAKLDLDETHQSWELLDEIEKASERARRLTQQLLTFSKGGEPVKRPLDIGSLIREYTNFALHGSSVTCEFAIPDNLPAVMGDPGQFDQVISNIVINARQAMQDTGTIFINMDVDDIQNTSDMLIPPGRYITIAIKDKGVGIPQKRLSRIFDPFYTTKDNGNGLGLSIVHSIIRAHGGHIRVESIPGQGTEFILLLPTIEQSPASSSDIINDVKKGKGRILVVDDEDVVLRLLGKLLGKLDYDYDLASRGKVAIALYKEALAENKPYDAVIIDLTIKGGRNGKEILRELHAIDANVQAIVSSGFSDNSILAEFEANGFVDRLIKPYTLQSLSQVLANVINK